MGALVKKLFSLFHGGKNYKLIIMYKSMVFVVLLVCGRLALAAPKPQSDQIEDAIDKGFAKLSEVSGAPKEALENAAETFTKIAGFIKTATYNIESMYAEMSEVEDLGNEISNDFLLQFNEVKNDIRECRQELRILAVSTVTHSKDLKDLVDGLDNNPDIVLLEATIDTMKQLLIKTKERLTNANTKYRNAIRIMEDIESRMKILSLDLENRANENSDEYKSFAHDVRAGTYTGCGGLAVGMIVADIFGCLGFCSASVTSSCFGAGIASVEGVLAAYRNSIAEFLEKTDNIKGSIDGMEEAVSEAVNVLEYELSIINEWEEISDNLSIKIEKYPVKYLQKFKAIRKIFLRNVIDLSEVAQKFLDQPISFFGDDDQET